MGKPRYYRANQGFATELDGQPLFVQKGELVHQDHPLLKGREQLFDPAPDFGRFDVVEQATQAPGEKRALPLRKPHRAPVAEKASEAPQAEKPAEKPAETGDKK